MRRHNDSSSSEARPQKPRKPRKPKPRNERGQQASGKSARHRRRLSSARLWRRCKRAVRRFFTSFISPLGWTVVVIGIVCAAGFPLVRWHELLAIAAVALMMILCAIVLSLGNTGFKASIAVSRRRVTVGDDVHVTVDIDNPGRTPTTTARGDLPLGEAHERFGIPVRLSNDANCAALAETVAGAAVGRRDMILITLGTGVGGGIIIDGKIYAGMRSMGAELGHTLLVLEGEHCTCGRDGCWEAYASATALIRQAKRAGEQHPESALHGREELTALDVFQAADAGDTAAQAVIDRWCVYVAAGMTDLVNSLAPEMILLGGGVSRQGERILSPIREYVAEHCFGGREGAVPIISPLGVDAGVIGGIWLGLENVFAEK